MLNKIKEDVAKVICCSQNYYIEPQEMVIGPLIDQWFRAKQDFIEAFGGKYILEIPDMVFHMNEQGKKEAYISFQSMAMEWVYAGELYSALLKYFETTEYEEFFNNKIDKDFNFGSISIKAGTKFVKSLKYFFPNLNLLDMIQTEASRIIQEDKIKGTLCISVHPLDFLSSSENNSNWRSCHSLDGEYRAGNLAYMTDHSTVICYLKSEGPDDIIRNFHNQVPWNNKKWRCLLYFDNHWKTIYAGRQYPFTCDMALSAVKEKLLPLVSSTFASGWSDWDNFTLTEVEGRSLIARYNLIRGKLYSPIDIMKLNNGLFFNDVISGTNFNAPYIYDKYYWNGVETIPYFAIGGSPICPICGSRHINRSELLICDECAERYSTYWEDEDDVDEYYHCEECGDECYFEDLIHVEGTWICPNCAEELTGACDNCGAAYFKENLAYCPETKDTRCRNCGGKFKED